MRTSIFTAFVLSGIILALQGCASTGSNPNMASQGSDMASSDYLNREMVASPAARLSAGSGAMHSGMSGGR